MNRKKYELVGGSTANAYCATTCEFDAGPPNSDMVEEKMVEERCSMMCDNLLAEAGKQCYGYSHSMWNNCRLFTDVISLSWTYAKAEWNGCWARTGCSIDGTAYHGADVSHASTTSWESCMQNCNEEQECEFWTWLKSNGDADEAICYLKTGTGTPTASDRTISGSKHCGPLKEAPLETMTTTTKACKDTPRARSRWTGRSGLHLQCRGPLNYFVQLKNICDDCYNLYKDAEVYGLCTERCFHSEYFKACLSALLIDDYVDENDGTPVWKMVSYMKHVDWDF